MIRYLILHRRVLGPRGVNVLMADVAKRSLGVSTSFIGGNILTTGYLAYIDAAKALRDELAAEGLIDPDVFDDFRCVLSDGDNAK